jgi:hypothetical protein
MPRPSSRTIAWLATYLAVMVALTVALFYVRRVVVERLSQPEALANWKDWKTDTERMQQQPATATRRPVKSAEPPALVLLRDHFGPILATTLIIASFMLGFLAVTIGGSLAGPRVPPGGYRDPPA